MPQFPIRPAPTFLLVAGLGWFAATPPVPASAQGVEESIRVMAEENANLYVEPLIRGLGFAMNGGAFDSARPLGRFGFDLGVRAMASSFPDEARSFTAVLPSTVTYQGRSYSNPYIPDGGSAVTPTAAGSGPGVLLVPSGEFHQDLLLAGENPNDYNIRFPEGQIDLSAMPFALAHASMGIGFGTELTLRFIPDLELHSEVGSVSSMGWAAKHELTHWFPSPVNLSVSYATQSLKVGDYLDGSASHLGALAGVGFGPLSVYASGGLRRAGIDVSYLVENPDGNPALPVDGERIDFRGRVDSDLVFGVGAKLQLLLLNISGQYTADEYRTLSLKVGIGIR